MTGQGPSPVAGAARTGRTCGPTGEVFRALGVLCEPARPGHPAVAAALGLARWPSPDAAPAELFVLDLLPSAAVYLGPEGMLGGAAGERIAGFWSALGFDPPAEPDHLAALLGLYATLCEWECWSGDSPDAGPAPGPGLHDANAVVARRLLVRHARRTLLREHLLTWVPAFTTAVVKAGSPPHAAWGQLLQRLLLDEAVDLLKEAGEVGERPVPPLLRDAPGLPGPQDGIDTFLSALLAPARSGLVLTRQDLFRCAEDLGLGLRMGGRGFVLRHLLDQDPGAALSWLSHHASWWADEHRRLRDELGAIGEHWHERALAAVAEIELRLRLVDELPIGELPVDE